MKRLGKLVASISLILSSAFFSVFALTSCAEEHKHHYDHEVILKQPTCTEPGLGYVACPDDNAKSETVEIPALGHHLVTKTIAPTCTKSGFDVTYCTRCGYEDHKENYVEPLGHDFQRHELPATCSYPGHVESFCTRCGIDEFEPFDTNARGHSYELVETMQPSCTGEGYDIFRCSACGKAHYANFVEPLGHDYHYTIKNPTCVADGEITATCERCGKTASKVGDKALGHDWTHHEEIVPTCTGEGLCAYDECNRCGERQGYCPLDALGHDFERAYVVAPTCLEDGYTMYECRYCHETKKGDIKEALGHHLISVPKQDPTCDECGHEAYVYCDRCDFTTYQEIEPLGQDHVYEEEIVAPTTRTKGYTRHTCLTCGHSYVDSYVAPIHPLREETAQEAIANGHSQIKSAADIVQSIRNDDTYYYLLYVGHISDFPLHTFVTLQMDAGTAELGSYPRQTAVPTATDMKETYEQNLATMAKDVPSMLEKTSLVSSMEQVSLSTDSTLDSEIASMFNTKDFPFKPIEAQDPNFSTVQYIAKNVGTSYVPGEDLDSYEVGYTYSYNFVSDVDLYVGVVYDKTEQTYKYRFLSELTGSQEEEVFAIPSSEGSDVNAFAERIELDETAPEKFVKPTRYTTNHPYVAINQKSTNRIKIPYNQEKQYAFSNSKIRESYEKGYDTARCIVKWKWSPNYSDKPILFLLHVSDTMVVNYDDGHYQSTDSPEKLYKGYWVYYGTSNQVAWDFRFSLSGLLVYNGFTLEWRNGGTGLFTVGDQYIDEISIDVYIYSSSAYNDGAYENTPVTAN